MSDSRYDVAIIGSGLGGLVSADILARNGRKVAVFEKHSVPGGCLQSFTRDGLRFETGMHYVGSMREGEVLYRYFKYLGIADGLKLSKMDENAYERVFIGDEEYRYAGGYDNFVDTLGKSFPNNKDDIRNYVRLCSSVTASSPMYSFGDHNNIALLQPAFVTTSVGEMLDSITDNERLKQVLSAITPLYGGVREMTPLYIHALIWDFYNRGAYRIVGGSDLIAKLLCESIRSRGGEIFTDSEVLAVNCSEHKAESLDVKGMGTVPCDYVISDIHPQILLDIIDSPLIRKIYRERICSMKQTVSNFSVYMKFKPDTLPYINSNCYHYGDDVWNCQSYDDSSWPKNFLYMHQCSADGQKFATHAIAFAYMNWDDVARWETTRVGRRGADYEEFKAQCCEKLLSSLESRFPGTRACIGKVWTSTPLTYRDYTGTVGGSMYGILHDKARLNQTTVAQRTKIPNLFLAGQNINSHGILGVTIGAILATSEILGYDSLMTQIKNETR